MARKEVQKRDSIGCQKTKPRIFRQAASVTKQNIHGISISSEAVTHHLVMRLGENQSIFHVFSCSTNWNAFANISTGWAPERWYVLLFPLLMKNAGTPETPILHNDQLRKNASFI